MDEMCVFCGKPLDPNRVRSDFALANRLHKGCWNVGVVVTAARRWFKAEEELRAHSHARSDNGGDWQYVPEKLATNKQQAEGDLFEAVRQLNREG